MESLFLSDNVRDNLHNVQESHPTSNNSSKSNQIYLIGNFWPICKSKFTPDILDINKTTKLI